MVFKIKDRAHEEKSTGSTGNMPELLLHAYIT
jgi:hypothetical protein